MQIASNFFLVKFGNIIFMFGTYGSLSNMTFGNYVRLSYWWRSIDPSITIGTLNLIKSVELWAVQFPGRRKGKRLKLWTIENVNSWKYELLKVWTIEIAAVEMA